MQRKSKDAKGKGKGKDGKGNGKIETFQGYCKKCGKWGRKAKDCWSRKGAKGNRNVNAVDEGAGRQAEQGGARAEEPEEEVQEVAETVETPSFV